MRWLLLLLWSMSSPLARADLADSAEAARSFELPPGFKIEVVAAEPQLMNPVAFSMNEIGQLYVVEAHRLNTAVVDITKNTNWLRDDLSFRTHFDRARFLISAMGTNAYYLTNKSDRLRLLQDTNRDGVIDDSKMVFSFRGPSAGLAAGVLARGSQVWVTCIPDLWLLDNLEFREKSSSRILHSGFGVHIGVTGHDLHGLALGMDGKIYFSVGDRGFSVQGPTGILSHPDTGGVLRCNPNGSELEVVAIGLRNPQELAFDELGNLWTADNDTAGEDKCRLIHVVEGADYGWRTSYQHMKGFGPWVREKLWEGRLDGTLPSCGDPGQGPSGLAYNPGSGLPSEFAGRFLMCDFPGGIQSFAVEPNGASYLIKDRKRFLWNAWPTDVEFGTDGALYFSDWVSGWTIPNKGRIYRLTHPDSLAVAKSASTAQAFRGGFEGKDAASLLALLEHHDLRVRQNAHLALTRARDAVPRLQALAVDASKPRAQRMHAIWALKLQGGLSSTNIDILLADADAEIRANAAGAADSQRLGKALRDESPRVRFAAATALQKRMVFDPGAAAATDAILEMIEKNADLDPYLTHAGVRVLALSPAGLNRARRHASPAVRRAAMLTERRLGVSGVANYLKDPALRYEAARAINDVPILNGFSQLGVMLTNGCPPEILSRAINANFRAGGPFAARRLAIFAADAAWPAAARVDALECLATWQEPDEIDRVVGLWRPIKADLDRRSDALAMSALEPVMAGLLKDKESPVVMAALQCVENLVLSAHATNILELFKAAERPPDVRVEALKTLEALGDGNYANALETALRDSTLRIAALALVQSNAPPGIMARVVELIANEQDPRTVQAACAAVRRSPTPEAVEPLKKRLANKDAAPELVLDLMETARKFPGLEVLEASTEARWTGGDAVAGKRLYEGRQDLACVRCHAIKGEGGTVGPALDGIGGKQSRAYLLDSIVEPNKEIASGFEMVSIRLLNGTVLAGKVTQETALTLLIDSLEDGPVTIRKNEIRTAVKTLSAMPEGLGAILSPFELRDLVEYLASLQ